METFGRAQLYVQTRIILIAFENGMDNISAQIGATETLNLYRDLVLQLKKWMQSYRVLCFILCEATFVPNISSRFQIVNQQLARSYHNAHDYYNNELNFPYHINYSFHKSICFSCCKLYPDFVGMFVGLFEVLLLLLIGEVNRMRLYFKKMRFLNSMHVSTVEKVAFIVVGMTPEVFLPEIAIPWELARVQVVTSAARTLEIPFQISEHCPMTTVICTQLCYALRQSRPFHFNSDCLIMLV